MIDSTKVKNRVIFTLLVVIMIMVTAIVILARNNEYGSKPGYSGDERWKVEFTSIAEYDKKGEATSRFSPYYVGTNAYFYADFVKPGDSMTYIIQVSNLGTIDAKLDDIIYVTNQYSDAIKYEIIDIQEGFELKSGKSYNFKVRIYYELDSNIAKEFDKPIEIKFNFEQDDL